MHPDIDLPFKLLSQPRKTEQTSSDKEHGSRFWDRGTVFSNISRLIDNWIIHNITQVITGIDKNCIRLVVFKEISSICV